MAKATQKAASTDVKVLTILIPADDRDDVELPDSADIIHEMVLDLDEPELSTSGNSYKAAFGSAAGDDAPRANVRIEGKVLELPLTIAVNAYFSKKAVDKAMRRGK